MSQASAPPADAGAAAGRRGLWQSAGFRRLWLATSLSVFGNTFSLFAVPLLVFSLTGSAVKTGATLALSTVPYVLVSPFAGVVADRCDRRRVLLVTSWLQAAVTASVPAAYAGGVLTLAQVYVAVFVAGALSVQFGAVSLSIVPQLVTPGQLVSANAAQQFSLSAALLAGPPVAGLVVAASGRPATAIAVDAATFASCALLLHRLPRAANVLRAAPRAVRSEIGEGLTYIWRHRVVRTLAMLLFTVNVVDSGVLGQLVVYGRRTLRVSAFSLSLLYAAAGVGSVLAAVAAAWLGRRFTLARIVQVALPVLAAGVAVLAVTHWLALALVGMVLLGGSQTVVFVNLIALRQRIVPDRLQGRVNATARALAVAGSPVGAFAAGVLVGPLGGVRTVFIALALLGVGNAVAAGVLLRPDPQPQS